MVYNLTVEYLHLNILYMFHLDMAARVVIALCSLSSIMNTQKLQRIKTMP